jgi:hypothetical protein
MHTRHTTAFVPLLPNEKYLNFLSRWREMSTRLPKDLSRTVKRHLTVCLIAIFSLISTKGYAKECKCFSQYSTGCVIYLGCQTGSMFYYFSYDPFCCQPTGQLLVVVYINGVEFGTFYGGTATPCCGASSI